MSVSDRELAVRLVGKYETEAAKLEAERRKLRWLWYGAVTTWPIGLIWNWKVTLIIPCTWLTLWFTGLYLNWVHRWENHERLRLAREKLDALPSA